MARAITLSLFGRLAVLSSLAFAGCGPTAVPDSSGSSLSLVETLGGADTVGYARAVTPRVFDFPADHGSHPDFRTEWWYVTGNVASAQGRAFGFQFTIFRSSLSPDAPGGPSAWSTNQAYMGHFAVTDIETGQFRSFERIGRGSVGLAGVTAVPFRTWIEDWALEGQVASPTGATDVDGGVYPMRLRAEGSGTYLDLSLEGGKDRVLQGDRGLSMKGPEPGNASFYYSRTRMPASGRLVLDADTFDVDGLAWLDREWSTSALSEGQVGWDWFALQLDDGWEMMIYQLRGADGSAGPMSAGAIIDPEGERMDLALSTQLLFESTGTWTSAIDGTSYPSGWRIQVPSRGWDLAVTPAVLDQELDLSFRYWEGAVRVRGSGEGGRAVTGAGYAELTGYAESDPGR
jgi:predicted secreted hydrolase